LSSAFILFLNYGCLVGTQKIDCGCSASISKLSRAHAPGTSEVGAPVSLDHLTLGVEIAPEHVSASVSSLQNASNHCSSITANPCK